MLSATSRRQVFLQAYLGQLHIIFLEFSDGRTHMQACQIDALSTYLIYRHHCRAHRSFAASKLSRYGFFGSGVGWIKVLKKLREKLCPSIKNDNEGHVHDDTY